jgi:SAM-dependent methyltransferase
VTVPFAEPDSGHPLRNCGDRLVGENGDEFPIIDGIPRFCEGDNYARSFGRQWNLFDKTQLDGEGARNASAQRLFAETCWRPLDLDGVDILEVGSGAGRFSHAILQHSRANLYSVDYSSAVEANMRNNLEYVADRFHLAQASIYEMPFADDSFDKVLCLGVLQHTPDFDRSVAALIRKAKPGGEIVVDFYPIRGWWTKLHAKYLLRPFTRRMNHDRLLDAIDRNANWLIAISRALRRVGFGSLTRFLPLVDLGTLPSDLRPEALREWAVLDTFDMFSPAFDNPQRVVDVAAMFEKHGAEVTFAGFVHHDSGRAAVVRGRKRPSAS